MAKFLSLYGNREGTCLTLQSPTSAQLNIFRAIMLTAEEHNAYITSTEEERLILLNQYRAANPQISGEKKKIVQSTVVVAPVVKAKKEQENKVEAPIEVAEIVVEEVIEKPIEETIEEPTEQIEEQVIEEIIAEKPVKKQRKPKNK
jgi:hypothetical protein